MKYVALYKTLLLIQKKANDGKERNFDTFFAGLIGGYLIFGDRNPVNEQVRSFFRRKKRNEV
jgi:peroxisomal membrane protein 4